jgi:hypothetical protein
VVEQKKEPESIPVDVDLTVTSVYWGQVRPLIVADRAEPRKCAVDRVPEGGGILGDGRWNALSLLVALSGVLATAATLTAGIFATFAGLAGRDALGVHRRVDLSVGLDVRRGRPVHRCGVGRAHNVDRCGFRGLCRGTARHQQTAAYGRQSKSSKVGPTVRHPVSEYEQHRCRVNPKQGHCLPTRENLWENLKAYTVDNETDR